MTSLNTSSRVAYILLLKYFLYGKFKFSLMNIKSIVKCKHDMPWNNFIFHLKKNKHYVSVTFSFNSTPMKKEIKTKSPIKFISSCALFMSCNTCKGHKVEVSFHRVFCGNFFVEWMGFRIHQDHIFCTMVKQ